MKNSKSLYINLFTAAVHSGIIFLAYSASARYVYDNQIKYIVDRTSTAPAEGNLIIFWSVFAACIASILFTAVIWYFAKKKTREVTHFSIKNFIVINLIPIVGIIATAYLTFDQLVAVIFYTLFLVLLIYFRDY